MKINKKIITLFFLALAFGVKAQETLNFPASRAHVLQFDYGVQVPANDMAKRFGTNSAFGFGYYYKSKTNWIIGGEFQFITGSKVKENNILDSLVTSSGHAIDLEGNLVQMEFSERGYSTFAKVGKIFPTNENENSGFIFTAGVGFLQHKIRMRVPDNIPQLGDDYVKGYDRLTNGLALKQFFGYQFLDPRLRFNYYIGIEAVQGFTKNRRSYNYDTRMRDDSERFDTFYGLRFGMLFPIYRKTQEKGTRQRYS